MGAVRPQRLAQHGLSRSAPVSARLRSHLKAMRLCESVSRLERAKPVRCRNSRKRAMRYACRSRLPASSTSSSANPRAPAPSSSPCSAMPSCRAAARSGSARCWSFSRAIDIDSGVVRTAMSRLAADGWLEREKVGRNSFYRLVKKGRQTFDAATRHIYDPPPSDWTGRFELLLIGNGEDRDASREALKNAGFGSPLPGVWVAPSGVPDPGGSRGRDPSGSLRRGRQRPAPAQRELAARSHRGRLSEIHENLRAAARLDRPPRTLVGRRRLHRADPADPPLPARGAARSAAADGAAAGGLAGQGGPRTLRRDLSRAASRVRTMA